MHFSLKVVACIFYAYHNLKFTYAPRFHSGGDLDPTQQIPLAEQSVFLRSFAEVFRTEALELGCPTRCFDLASFNSFVDGQSAIAAVAASTLVQASADPTSSGM